MSEPPAAPKFGSGTQPSPRRGRLLISLVVLGAAIAVGIFLLNSRSHRGAAYLTNLEKAAAQRENKARGELSTRLAAAGANDGASTVSVELAAVVFQSVAAHFVGLTMEFGVPRIGPIRVKVEQVQVEFRDGFPRLGGDLAVTAQGRTIEARTLAVLEPQLLPGKVELKVQCLGIAPLGAALPEWAATIANAEATSAANRELAMHPISLPLQDSVEFGFPPPVPIETEIKTPNGKVFVRITLPAGKAVRRWVQPREVFFTSDGLHLLVSLSETAPQEVASPRPPVSAASGDALARWRLAPGESVRVRVGRGPILSLLDEINAWPESNRTVQFQSFKTEGHILDRTGGLPFGNGFGAWLEGPDRLRGTVILRKFVPTWENEKQRISFAITTSAEGSAQVHFHGNAPHIDPPKIFGMKIGGGVTLGGGTGTSIGAIVPRQESAIAAAAVLNPEAQVLEVRVLEPGELRLKLDIGGVPDELERLFKIGFQVPMPRERALYQVALPKLIADTVIIPLPQQAGGGIKRINLSTALNSRLDPAGVQLSGTMVVAPPAP